MGYWYRAMGCDFNGSWWSAGALQRYVKYRNSEPATKIKEIEICKYEHDVTLIITFSWPFTSNALAQRIKELFPFLEFELNGMAKQKLSIINQYILYQSWVGIIALFLLAFTGVFYSTNFFGDKQK